MGEGHDPRKDEGQARDSRNALCFFAVVAAITAVGAWLMARDLSGTVGWSVLRVGLWVLFVVLFGHLAFGFCHSLFGFCLRRIHWKVSNEKKECGGSDSIDEPPPRVAVLMPIYNEPVARVFAGICAVVEDVALHEEAEQFDFFLLSDSTSPDQWIAEEAAWQVAREKLVGEGGDMLYYRRRPENRGRKSGNIEDFCRCWGASYRYLVVLDADSIMSGDTLVTLLRRMEAHPRMALLQTAPALYNGETIYGRIQQFAGRLYAPIFLEGLAYWQQSGGNYWGHNAMLRMKPFAEHCGLPELPGPRPFGGAILSHDFVEAGLLRRAGWEVWLAHDLGGSYEEGPQGMLESAVRDRRWCQGNLQHSLIVGAPRFRLRTRLHLISGIFAYLSSPLWLLFLLLGSWMVLEGDTSGSRVLVGVATLVVTGVLLFGSKLLALIDLALDRTRWDGFGGLCNALRSAMVETLFSAVIAPVTMLFHTQFVVANLLGRSVAWTTQQRGARRTSWSEALSAHWTHTLLGLGVGVATALTHFVLFLWLIPIWLGLCLAIPLSVWTSGHSTRSQRLPRLFRAPDEEQPATVLARATVYAEEFSRDGVCDLTLSTQGLIAAVVDAKQNALHIALLREREQMFALEADAAAASVAYDLDEIGDRLLREGPEALQSDEIFALLYDADALADLHRRAQQSPASVLAPCWAEAKNQSRRGRPPGPVTPEA